MKNNQLIKSNNFNSMGMSGAQNCWGATSLWTKLFGVLGENWLSDCLLNLKQSLHRRLKGFE